MKSKRKERQVCDVTYFEDKKRRPIKAVVTFTPQQRRCVQFTRLQREVWL